jgi:heat shock protein HslJ
MVMRRIRPARRLLCLTFCILAAALSASGPVIAQSEFPFDQELLLDAAPMRGSKRVPSLDIRTNGAAEIALWCNTVRAQLVVVGDTITVLTGPSTERQCPPERLLGDAEILSTLAEVTNWRREGDLLTLTGPRTVRFRLQTN